MDTKPSPCWRCGVQSTADPRHLCAVCHQFIRTELEVFGFSITMKDLEI